MLSGAGAVREHPAPSVQLQGRHQTTAWAAAMTAPAGEAAALGTAAASAARVIATASQLQRMKRKRHIICELRAPCRVRQHGNPAGRIATAVVVVQLPRQLAQLLLLLQLGDPGRISFIQVGCDRIRLPSSRLLMVVFKHPISFLARSFASHSFFPLALIDVLLNCSSDCNFSTGVYLSMVHSPGMYLLYIVSFKSIHFRSISTRQLHDDITSSPNSRTVVCLESGLSLPLLCFEPSINQS